MAGRVIRRVWASCEAARVEGGFGVLLDGKPLRTPAKSVLAAPAMGLAEAVAREWDFEGDSADPESMPMTRMANSAIDRVAPNHARIAAMLSEYGESDLLCYRAEEPEELVRRQSEAWDPLLEWAGRELHAPLEIAVGMMPRPQPASSLERLRSQVFRLDAFALGGFHELTVLSGSLVIALAALHGFSDPEALWESAALDETWQIEKWGEDTEAAEALGRRRRDFLLAERFCRLCRG